LRVCRSTGRDKLRSAVVEGQRTNEFVRERPSFGFFLPGFDLNAADVLTNPGFKTVVVQSKISWPRSSASGKKSTMSARESAEAVKRCALGTVVGLKLMRPARRWLPIR